MPTKGLPFSLKRRGLICQFLAQIFIIMIIGVLWILSDYNNGIVSVPDTPSSLFGDLQGIHSALLWTYALLWTWFPAFAMGLYSSFYAAMVNCIKATQPMMELMRPAGREKACVTCKKVHGRNDLPCFTTDFCLNKRPKKARSTAKLTLLLDYNTCPIINSVQALAHRHFLVAVCMLIQVLLTLMSGLSAAILSVASVPVNSTIAITFNSYFDDWNLSTTTSTRPAFDIASANLINGGLPFSWTTQNYSILPFYPAAGSASGNLTGDTLAYSSSLDCSSFAADDLIKEGAVTLTGGTPDSAANGSITVNFNFTDRGCSIDQWVLVYPSDAAPQMYGQTWAVTECPLDANPGRLGIITGVYVKSAPFLLANFTLLSCIPSFWNSTASVTVSSNGNGSSEVTGLSVSTAVRWWPEFWDFWLNNIPYYRLYDPAQLSSMDSLAYLAYNYAVKQNATYPFDTELISASFQIVYSAVFAAFASASVYSPSPQTNTSLGTLLRLQNRLFVVSTPAIAIIVIVGVALLTTIWVAVYVTRNREILAQAQSLDLILGNAILVDGSDTISKYIEEIKSEVGHKLQNSATLENSDLVEYAKKTPALSEWECWLDKDGKLQLRRPEAVTVSEELKRVCCSLKRKTKSI